MRAALSLLFCCDIIFAFSQPIFKNPSFEGSTPNYGQVPASWETNLNDCGGRSTPDIQPGIWSTFLAAHHGKTYMGLVARTDNTAEAIFQTLSSPLLKGNCYSFTVYLARSFFYDRLNAPISLEIWAGNNGCERNELLWRSPVISHITWQPYQVNLSTSADYNTIIFLASGLGATGLGGNILIDDLSEERVLGPDITLKAQQQLCEGETLQLDVHHNEALSYAWNTGENTASIAVSAAGNYTVDVSFQHCTVSTATVITTKGKPRLVLGKDTVLYFGNDHYNIVSSGSPAEAKLEWSTGETTPVITAYDPGKYWASLSNECGVSTDSINISFLDLFVPNVVTDNDDGKNDKFQVEGVEPGTYALSIYNRWGDLIFSTPSYRNNWPIDKVASAVYYYVLHGPGNTTAFRGNIHLIAP